MGIGRLFFFGFAVLTATFQVAANDLSIARVALEDKLYKVAQDHVEKVLPELNPQSAEAADALKLLLRALDGQGQYAAMQETLDRYTATIKARPEMIFIFRATQAAYETGQYERAIAAAAIPNDIFGEWPDAVRRLAARSYLELNKPIEALNLFELIDTSSTNQTTRAENALEWSFPLEKQGQVEKAIVRLEPFAARIGEGSAFARCALRQAELFSSQKQPTSAARILRQMGGDLRVEESLRVDALVGLSAVAEQLGDRSLALSAARDAVAAATLARTQRKAGLCLGMLLLKDPQSVKEGIDLLRSVIRLNPSDPSAPRMQLYLANALLENDQPEAALVEYRIYAEAYDAPELAATALSGRARALTKLGRYAEALPLFAQAIERTTDSAERLRLLEAQAQTAHADRNYTLAAELYTRLLSEAGDRDDGRFSLMLADTYERMGKHEEALEQFRSTVMKFPEGSFSGAASLRLGGLLTDMNRLNEAIEVYTRVIETATEPDLKSAAYLGRGRTYYRAFRFDVAVPDLLKTLDGDAATQEEARFFLVLSLYGLGRDTEARAAAEDYLKTYPESARLPEVILWLGKSDFNHGNYQQARATFLNFMTRWPDNLWADAALLWSARAAFLMKDFTGVVELTARLVKEYPKSTRLAEARFIQAEALMEMARFNEAVVLLDEIHARYPDSEWAVEAWGRKGDCLSTMGVDHPARYAEAITAYREMISRLDADSELRLQYQYKIGRVLEKQKRIDEAIEQYYKEVVVRFLDDRTKGVWYGENGRAWFLKAVYQLSDLLAKSGQREQATRILQRVIASGVQGTDDVRAWLKRLEK